jgi:hypothetical protein
MHEKYYNLSGSIDNNNDFTLFSEGFRKYIIADLNNLNIKSLNIIGKFNFCHFFKKILY